MSEKKFLAGRNSVTKRAAQQQINNKLLVRDGIKAAVSIEIIGFGEDCGRSFGILCKAEKIG